MKTHQPHLGKEHFRQKECVCKGPEHMGINSTCLGNTQRIDSNWIPDPGIEPASPVSPALQADSLQLSHQTSIQLLWPRNDF